MKKSRFLALMMVLSLGLCLLTACGGGEKVPAEEENTIDLADTYWCDEEYGDYYAFYDDGTVYLFDEYGENYGEGEYTWDGTAGEIRGEGSDEGFPMTYEDGKLAVEDGDYTLYFEQVDALPTGEEDLEEVVLENTYWDIDGSTYYFYDDGSFEIDGEYGEYEWDGYYGTMSMDDIIVDIGYLGDDGEIYLEDTDGTLYLMKYIDVMAGGENESYSLAGAWDNDEEEISLEFTNDTFWMTSMVESVSGTYVCDGEYFTLTDEEGYTVEGYIDADGDLVFYDMDGYFYPVDEAYYVP